MSAPGSFTLVPFVDGNKPTVPSGAAWTLANAEKTKAQVQVARLGADFQQAHTGSVMAGTGAVQTTTSANTALGKLAQDFSFVSSQLLLLPEGTPAYANQSMAVEAAKIAMDAQLGVVQSLKDKQFADKAIAFTTNLFTPAGNFSAFDDEDLPAPKQAVLSSSSSPANVCPHGLNCHGKNGKCPKAHLCSQGKACKRTGCKWVH